MSDNPTEAQINIDIKDGENVDSDKSFESCVNSATEGINNLLTKDDDSEKSFQSCSMNINERVTVNNVEDDDDDDIRPGSCRENPSSDDDEVSSWDENNDHWIYDAEYLHESKNHKELPPAETVINDDSRQLCADELEYIVENHVAKDKPKKKASHNPTFIPTNGRFYMHDVRCDAKDSSRRTAKKLLAHSAAKSNDSWSHDLYDEHRQQPISKIELIDKYGEDIRSKGAADGRTRPKRTPRNTNNNYNKSRQFGRHGQHQQQQYYDYYDNYDNYDAGYDNYDDYYYYGADAGAYYYDYRYYGGNSAWKRRNYKSTNQKKPAAQSQKPPKTHPPSKYSEIAEFTDIKITVNLDNLGARHITSVSGGGNGGNPGNPANSGNSGKRGPPQDPPAQRRNAPAKERHGEHQQQRYNHRQWPIPDWMRSQLDWSGDTNAPGDDADKDKDKDTNHVSSRRHQTVRVPPPRFSRDKSAGDSGKAGRPQSFVPKRYSELRNNPHQQPIQNNNNNAITGSSDSHSHPHPAPQSVSSTMAPAEQQQLMAPYAPQQAQQTQQQQQQQTHQPQMMPPGIDYYSSMLQHPHHHHHQMMSLSSLLQSGYATAADTSLSQHHQQPQQQYYIHPLYLPSPAAAAAGGTRLSQYPPFVSPGSTVPAPLYPNSSSHNNNSSNSSGNPPPLNNNINNNSGSASTNAASSHNIRPVLGRS